jgi:hypothetical protein
VCVCVRVCVVFLSGNHTAAPLFHLLSAPDG